MEIAVADERAFVIREQVEAEVARGLAWSKKGEAFGTLARFFSRPKDEDVQLIYEELRYQPFWHVITKSRYVYERNRVYRIPLEGPQVKSVTINGQVFEAVGGALEVPGLDFDVEEHAREVFVDGLTGARGRQAVLLKYPAQAIEDLGAFQIDGAIVVPPDVRASAIVREAVSQMIQPIQADRLIEEAVVVEWVALIYHPVYAFKYRWQNKEGIVEVDGLTGEVSPNGKTFERFADRKVDRGAIFDVDVAASSLGLPAQHVVRVAAPEAQPEVTGEPEL